MLVFYRILIDSTTLPCYRSPTIQKLRLELAECGRPAVSKWGGRADGSGGNRDGRAAGRAAGGGLCPSIGFGSKVEDPSPGPDGDLMVHGEGLYTKFS